ncbi:MAG: hypothetical protein K2P78_07030 [Gemmataceae bacterium]|nr:hypothetical protein [Gemmataceae bacterium]
MRVLVIEDEPELLRVTAQALREVGYAADEAATGPDGLFGGRATSRQVFPPSAAISATGSHIRRRTSPPGSTRRCSPPSWWTSAGC